MKNDDLNSNVPGLRLSRRTFLVAVAASGAVIATGTAQAQTLVDETSAQAVALGYVADAKRADAKNAEEAHCVYSVPSVVY